MLKCPNEVILTLRSSRYVRKEHGRPQLEGEYTGMLELYNTAPHMVPKPHAWGEVPGQPSPTYFYICDYINLIDAMPDPVKLGAIVADLHKRSVSPTGKFGFYLPTYDGWQPQDCGVWVDKWTPLFARILTALWKLDSEVNGSWAELDAAMERTLSHVIPRLIGILESNGRSIKPCLIHGDLWETNIGTDIETGNIYIFDAAAYYGHNEMETGIWRVAHHRIKAEAYRKEYVQHYEKSEPVEEWDDRLKLYGVKTKLMYSAGVLNGQAIRRQ
jgi:protein-ribulosamine 3-kinase